jgi:hypothetical protein
MQNSKGERRARSPPRDLFVEPISHTAAECRGYKREVGMTALGRPAWVCCGATAAIFVAELGTSFDGGLCGLAGCGRNFECLAFRAKPDTRAARPHRGICLFVEPIAHTAT